MANGIGINKLVVGIAVAGAFTLTSFLGGGVASADELKVVESTRPAEFEPYFKMELEDTLVSGWTAAGDYDGDGDVDGRDFLIWQRGSSPTPISAGDLADWQTNYGCCS